MPGISEDLLDCKKRETYKFYFLILQASNINITFQYFVRGENEDIFYEKPQYCIQWTQDNRLDKDFGRVMVGDL